MEVPEMEQAINGFDSITASSEFLEREIERLREKARHDEAQALYNAKQEGVQEGFQKGFQKGLQKGISDRNVQIARAMAADGQPVDKIVRYTGLTQKEVEALV